MRFQFLEENQKKYNIKKARRILKISRSGYYEYLHRRKSKKSIENEALAEMILDIFKENEGRYGSRRIQKVLLQRNVRIMKTSLPHHEWARVNRQRSKETISLLSRQNPI